MTKWKDMHRHLERLHRGVLREEVMKENHGYEVNIEYDNAPDFIAVSLPGMPMVTVLLDHNELVCLITQLEEAHDVFDAEIEEFEEFEEWVDSLPTRLPDGYEWVEDNTFDPDDIFVNVPDGVTVDSVPDLPPGL